MMLIIHLDKNGKLKSKAQNIDPFTYLFSFLSTAHFSLFSFDVISIEMSPPPPSYFGLEKKRIAEGRKVSRASDKKPGPPLSSRCGTSQQLKNRLILACYQRKFYSRVY